MTWQIITADCLEAMAEMEEASVDAIVTDPPYGLEFMGKEWDRLGRNSPPSFEHSMQNDFKGFKPLPRPGGLTIEGMYAAQEWHHRWANAALRVLKPGGHLLAFGGTRTYHRLACAVEDAGFEIRDCLAWMYGSGFPKSLDVSKAIDKAAGGQGEWSEREGDTARVRGTSAILGQAVPGPSMQYAPATPEAQRWQGWGTALKPAFEPIVLARKPLVGSVAQNVQTYGTGALNIDATRINLDGDRKTEHGPRAEPQEALHGGGILDRAPTDNTLGRWPANVVLDPEAAALLDEQAGPVGSNSGQVHGADGMVRRGGMFGDGVTDGERYPKYETRSSGASRFFYCPKADREERDRGLEHRRTVKMTDEGYGSIQTPILDRATPRENWTPHEARNPHPTVKPVELMRWLCKLVTPPGGLVLDPFTGSGSTGIAALREGFDFVGIEREADYAEIARDRIIGDAPLFNVTEEVAP